MAVSSVLKEQLARLAEVVTAMAVGFLIGAIVMALSGYDPLEAYESMFYYAFGDTYCISMTLSFATPLMLTAITFAVGVRAGLFNIGAEGQVYMGALGAILVASLGIDSPLGLVLALLVGVALGVVWGLIAGVLRVTRGVHEVVSTIMLNWTAFWLVEYMRIYVLPDPHDPSKTIPVPVHARLPLLVPGTELSLAFIFALAFTVATYFLLWHTVIGYELRATGLNPEAARYAGIDVSKAMLVAFIIGGASAGLAGVCEVAGRPPHYAITTGLSNLFGLGFDGIAVSLIGMNHLIAIIPASILVGALVAGMRGMQVVAGVPFELVRVVQGVIIVALATPGLVRMIRLWMLRRRVVK